MRSFATALSVGVALFSTACDSGKTPMTEERGGALEEQQIVPPAATASPSPGSRGRVLTPEERREREGTR